MTYQDNTSHNPTAIDDFGEKIGGAKKDFNFQKNLVRSVFSGSYKEPHKLVNDAAAIKPLELVEAVAVITKEAREQAIDSAIEYDKLLVRAMVEKTEDRWAAVDTKKEELKALGFVFYEYEDYVFDLPFYPNSEEQERMENVYKEELEKIKESTRSPAGPQPDVLGHAHDAIALAEAALQAARDTLEKAQDAVEKATEALELAKAAALPADDAVPMDEAESGEGTDSGASDTMGGESVPMLGYEPALLLAYTPAQPMPEDDSAADDSKPTEPPAMDAAPKRRKAGRPRKNPLAAFSDADLIKELLARGYDVTRHIANHPPAMEPYVVIH